MNMREKTPWKVGCLYCLQQRLSLSPCAYSSTSFRALCVLQSLSHPPRRNHSSKRHHFLNTQVHLLGGL